MNQWLPLILFGLSAMFTPGPNNFMLLNTGLVFGLKKSWPHYWGVCLGFPFMLLIVTLGFGAIFTKWLWLQQALKVVGSLYMLYLAYKILISKNSHSGEIQTSRPLTFMQAVLFQWANPKGWLIAISVISVFTVTSNYLTNALAISGLFLVIDLASAATWLIFGAYLQKILKTPKHRLWFNIVMALCLVASIALIIWD